MDHKILRSVRRVWIGPIASVSGAVARLHRDISVLLRIGGTSSFGSNCGFRRRGTENWSPLVSHVRMLEKVRNVPTEVGLPAEDVQAVGGSGKAAEPTWPQGPGGPNPAPGLFREVGPDRPGGVEPVGRAVRLATCARGHTSEGRS